MFSILTYNIHKGFSHFFPHFRLHKMRQALLTQNPEIILLQEVCGKHTYYEQLIKKWPEKSQVEYLGDNVHWPQRIYTENAVYKHGHHGNGLMTRFKILEWENINVALNKFSSRSLLHAKLQVEEKHILHVICVHLGLFESERKKQLQTLSDRIKSHVPAAEALIIGGDFNDWRQQATQHLGESLGLQDAFLQTAQKQPKTFPAFYPMLSVDRIYYRGLKLLECQCLSGKPWRNLSDHLPLQASFTFVDETKFTPSSL